MSHETTKKTMQILQRDIQNLIYKFEQETKIRVEGVDVYRSASMPKELGGSRFEMQAAKPQAFIRFMVE